MQYDLNTLLTELRGIFKTPSAKDLARKSNEELYVWIGNQQVLEQIERRIKELEDNLLDVPT